MELRLLGSKIENIRSYAKALHQMVQPTAREVSILLGKLTHATHAMRAAPPPPPPLLQKPPSITASCKAYAGLLSALCSKKRCERGFELVCHSPCFMEREVHHSRQSRSNDRDADASNTGWGVRCGSLQTPGGSWKISWLISRWTARLP